MFRNVTFGNGKVLSSLVPCSNGLDCVVQSCFVLLRCGCVMFCAPLLDNVMYCYGNVW